jgi:hypothetical protein
MPVSGAMFYAADAVSEGDDRRRLIGTKLETWAIGSVERAAEQQVNVNRSTIGEIWALAVRIAGGGRDRRGSAMGGERSFAKTGSNDEVAPIPAVRLTRSVGSSRPL